MPCGTGESGPVESGAAAGRRARRNPVSRKRPGLIGGSDGSPGGNRPCLAAESSWRCWRRRWHRGGAEGRQRAARHHQVRRGARDRHADRAGRRPGAGFWSSRATPTSGPRTTGPAGRPHPRLRRHRRRRQGRPDHHLLRGHEAHDGPRRSPATARSTSPRATRSSACDDATATARPTARPQDACVVGSTRRATTRTTASPASPSTSTGDVYFGLGENLGADYKLIGSDGTTLAGGGEGGNIYRCRPDGTKLERVATGFWNPFARGLRRLRPAVRRGQRPRLAPAVPAAARRRRRRLRLPVPQRPQGPAPLHGLERRAARHAAMVAGTGEAPVRRASPTSRTACRTSTAATCWSPPGATTASSGIGCSRAGPRSGRRWSRSSTGGEDFRPGRHRRRRRTARSTSATGSTSRTTLHGKGRVWHVRTRTPRSVGRRRTAQGQPDSPDRATREAAAPVGWPRASGGSAADGTRSPT